MAGKGKGTGVPAKSEAGFSRAAGAQPKESQTHKQIAERQAAAAQGVPSKVIRKHQLRVVYGPAF